MVSDGRDDKIASALQSPGKAPKDHVHVLALRFQVGDLLCITVTRVDDLCDLVAQLSVRTVRILDRKCRKTVSGHILINKP